MSALGQKQTLDWRPLMSALPPKADMAQAAGNSLPDATMMVALALEWHPVSADFRGGIDDHRARNFFAFPLLRFSVCPTSL
jgi:hypothetical protein